METDTTQPQHPDFPLRWSAGAVRVLHDFKVAAAGHEGLVYPEPALAQLLNGPPYSTFTRHAVREQLLGSGRTGLRDQFALHPWTDTAMSMPMPGADTSMGRAYPPLVMEVGIEAIARQEGVGTVGERHITGYVRHGWADDLQLLGIDALRLHEYVTDMELGPPSLRQLYADSWHGFLDANIIVQARDLTEIPWAEEAKSEHVLLWISSSLLDELDRLRFYHRSNRVKKRVSQFSKWLAPRMQGALRGPGVEIRPSVSLRILAQEKKTSGHDPDHLESVRELRDYGIRITMVSLDLGVQARAIAQGIPVLFLSDRCLLPQDQVGEDAQPPAESAN